MSHKRKNKGTRSFASRQNGKAGRRTVEIQDGGEEENVMQVDDEAMLRDASEQPETQPEADMEATEEHPVQEPEEKTPDEGESASPEPEEEVAVAVDAQLPDLEKLREERDSYLDLARRERADFDNYRKRVQREMAEIKRESLANFLKEFFGPLDDMDRVLQESSKSQSFDSLVEGVRIMEENFWRVLAKAGVRKIDAMGKPFDPQLHEAMTTVPSADVTPNTVMEVYENGYKIDDFVLRPARVIVSRAPDA